MRSPPRRLEAVTLAALGCLLGLVVYFWNPILQAHQLRHNRLAQAGVHTPTADLFLYAIFALVLYVGSRMWGWIAPHVFALGTVTAERWRQRLLWLRFVSTMLFLGLTILTISRAA